MKLFNKFRACSILTKALILVLLIATPAFALWSFGIKSRSDDAGYATVVDSKLRTIPLPYGDAIQEGIIPGHYPLIKFGSNGAVGTSEELVWPLSNGRTYLTAAETLKVSSADADDTSAGTGARTIQIYGQLDGYIEANETIILNGVTAVETTNAYLRIYRARVITAGSSGINEGRISINDNANVLTKLTVEANRGSSEAAFFTVPAARTLYIKEIHASESGNKKVTIRLYSRDNTITDAAWNLAAPQIVVNLGDSSRAYPVPLKFTQKTDIRFVAEAGLSGGIVDDVSIISYYED